MNLSDFHFLRPWWLLALPAGLWLLSRSRRRTAARERWQKVCDPHLLDHLLTGENESSGRSHFPALALMLTLAVLALAGPTWEKLPQPLYRAGQGRVIVLDLSASMDCPDIPPSRLTRARYRAIDLIKAGAGLEQGVVVFAGDAFIVAPLTDDRKTLLNLMPGLDTETVPVPGSRADRGLEEAGKLLARDAVGHGQIILISDDADELTIAAARKLKTAGHRVDVITVGTRNAAPIPLPDGGYLKDKNGRIVVPVPDFQALERTAEAGGGICLGIDAPESAFAGLSRYKSLFPGRKSQSQALGDRWRDFGPWLLLPLLVLAAGSFRRGWLLLIPLLLLPGWAGRARAFTLQDLWLRPDQQAVKAFQHRDYENAGKLAEDPEWRAAALYRAGKFKQAAAALKGIDNPRAHYNRGNALARAGELEAALKAYDQALKLDPGFQDAKANRELVARLLQQKQKQQQQQQKESSEKNQNQDGQGKDQQQKQQNRQKGSGQDARDGSASSGRQPPDNPDKPSPPKAAGKENRKPENRSSDRTDSEKQTDRQEKNRRSDKTGKDQKETKQQQEKAAAKAAGRKPESGEQSDKARAALESDQPHPDAKKQALEQWLRRVPDDPGGLLKRKFYYQYRGRRDRSKGRKTW
jgi:Ca-activated chloride channel family protein